MSNQILAETTVISQLETVMGSGYTFYDESVPAASTLKISPDGNIKPYITYQVSDMQYTGKGSFAGVRKGEYFVVFDFQIVGSTASVVKKIRAKINDSMLGYKPAGLGGELSKEFATGTWVITDAQNKPQAYVSHVAFRLYFDFETSV